MGKIALPYWNKRIGQRSFRHFATLPMSLRRDRRKERRADGFTLLGSTIVVKKIVWPTRQPSIEELSNSASTEYGSVTIHSIHVVRFEWRIGGKVQAFGGGTAATARACWFPAIAASTT